jgi:hypothetical protein
MAESEEKRLAVVESGRSPDAYEKRYMAGEGMVLHRAKQRAPWHLHALMGLSAAGMLGAVFAAPGAWLAPVIGMPILLVAWLLFAVLRVTVSEGHVNIQYGLFGPKIPIAAIQSATATRYRWTKFGGWGIKRSLNGEWIYNMPGDGGRAVRIEWTNAKGKRNVTLIGSKDPEALAAAIHQAQRALGPGDKRQLGR